MKNLAGYFIPLIAGGLTPLAFAPYDFWPLLFLPPFLWWLSLSKLNQRSFVNGWLFGLGYFAVGASWIQVSIYEFGHAPFWLSVLLTGLFVAFVAIFHALQAFAYSKWFKLTQPAVQLFGFAACWVLFEWLRSWLLTGFPWNYLGNAMIDTPLSGYSPVLGVFGTSWVVAISSLILGFSCQALLSTRTLQKSHALLLALVLSLWAIGYGLYQQAWTSPLGTPQQATLIQANIPQDLKWSPHFREPTLSLYRDLTKKYSDSDLVIWSENAVPMFREEAKPFIEEINQLATNTNTAVVSGIPTFAYDKSIYYNSLIAFGEASGIYKKHHLVPFGEYVPFEALIRGVIAFFDLPMSGFSPGPWPQKPLKIKNYQASAAICYEIAYPKSVASSAQNANLIITLSNDTWFGESIGPHQHLQIARQRALETGRYVLRATNNGITAIIDPQGKVQDSAPQFKRTVLTGPYQPHQGHTPYMRFGDWPALILFALFPFFIALAGIRKKG